MDFSQISISSDSTDLFVEYLQSGAKSTANRRVGVEIEVFGYDAKTLQRLDNEQIKTVLTRLALSKDDLISENNLIVETHTADGGKWTVEPGGQLEFSCAARASLFEIEEDLRANVRKLNLVGKQLNFTFLALGFDPLRRIDEQNWYLKERYRVMKPYLATRGRRAWDMMTRTAAVQVNLDYESETDLVRKFIVANRLAPIVSAIAANSPFADGDFSGYKSVRAATWLETDNDRCGISPLALKDDFKFKDFIEYALGIPMLFVRRENEYSTDFTGKTFQEFLANQNATLQNWTDHLTTIFTEARVKNYLEIRSADAGNIEHALAVCALWKGLLYDEKSLQTAFEIALRLPIEKLRSVQFCTAKNALQAKCDNVQVLEFAKEIVCLAASSLQKIAPAEIKFLEVLQRQVLVEAVSPADKLLEISQNSIEKVFEACSI